MALRYPTGEGRLQLGVGEILLGSCKGGLGGLVVGFQAIEFEPRNVAILHQFRRAFEIAFAVFKRRQAILNDEIPLSIGGGIGQSRVQMLLLRKAHLGEVSTTIWPQQLHEICEERNIHVLK